MRHMCSIHICYQLYFLVKEINEKYILYEGKINIEWG